MKIPANPLAPSGKLTGVGMAFLLPRLQGGEGGGEVDSIQQITPRVCFAKMFYHSLTLALSPCGERESRYLPQSVPPAGEGDNLS